MLSLLDITGAGDLCMTAGDCFLYNRSSQHLAVKLDGNFLANITRGQVSKFFAALIAEFQANNSLVALRNLRLSILQVAACQYNLAAFILELQHSSTAQHSDSLFRILYARQLNNNTVLALALNNRLSQAQLVDTAFNNLYAAVNGVVVNLQLRCIHSLQNNVGTTL